MYRAQPEAKMVTSHKANERQLCSSGEIIFLPEVILSRRQSSPRKISIL